MCIGFGPAWKSVYGVGAMLQSEAPDAMELKLQLWAARWVPRFNLSLVEEQPVLLTTEPPT